MEVTHLITHSGGFHADELLSSVILMRLFPQAEIVRSRAAEWITPGPGRIIYDVGRAFDPEARVFDHHQRPAPLRPDGQPFSSFGLIWRQFGRDYLRALAIPEADIDPIHAGFDAGFVLPIDLMDNGAVDPSVAGPLAGLTLPVLLESLKPVWDDLTPDAEDRAFAAALPVARSFVEAAIARAAGQRRAETIVEAAIARAGTDRILELPGPMPYGSAIGRAGAEHLLFVIHPRNGDWALNGIRKEKGSFAQRADLPEAWAGLTDEALEAASGVSGAKFCHNARFIAVADSREAILRMAQIAVSQATN
ncbi:MYG1 family protein [Paenirhodobacter sp.]|uniref:MYG1 family protein n=1 Tax=Paenirhodobacter sp. TaxID=1965326 RepID=UPI003B3D4CE1